MLLANSLVLGSLSLAVKHRNIETGALPLICAGGLLLCIFWFFLTRVGWGYQNERIKVAQQFTWPNYQAPLLSIHKPDWIYILAIAVIVLFGVGYIIFYAILRT
jgi:hypothetical protein